MEHREHRLIVLLECPTGRGLASRAGAIAAALRIEQLCQAIRQLHVIVRIVDGGTPQPPQRFEPVEFLLWVAKQITLAEKVFTCYEAGPFGYSLHRKLEKINPSNSLVPELPGR